VTLVVFVRGVNVGGHKTLRPSVIAKRLAKYDVLNVGAAGTFIVRRPRSQKEFRAALLRALPFEAEVVCCNGSDLVRMEKENPFDAEARPDVVRFVSILCKAPRLRPSIPIALPSADEWLVRVIARNGRYVFGEYRRHMKTIGYLGRLDRLFSVPLTTRNWNTIVSVVRMLKA
jgi:uncharacterized protein (DUF1697 family)